MKTERATFAGGCFWCMEHPFDKIDGILEVTVGYTGGEEENPTYDEVCSGMTGHIEAVQIVFDPDRVAYSDILDVFWRQINPTDPGGQFVDRGHQYMTAIFYHGEYQKKEAEKSLRLMNESGLYDSPIVTEIREAGPFYRAEEYHQGYYRNNTVRYNIYRKNSGRDQFLKRIWIR